MEFRLAGPKDRDLVENLWAYCFEPREHPFFQWYFSCCYKPENVLMGFIDGQMACLTHLNPYTLNIRGSHIPVSYIVGLATHPAARRGGVGGKLLAAALMEMRRRGHYVNILMPSKAGFYQPYGYELYCHQWRETLPMEALRPLSDRTIHFGFLTSNDQWPLLAAVYDDYTQGLCGYAIRDEAAWRRLIDGQLAEGCIAVAFDGSEPVGYLFYQLGSPVIHCGEFVYRTYKGKKGLLGYLYNHRSQGESVQWNEGIHDQSYRFYPDGKAGHETMPFMTARIVDVAPALEALAYGADLDGTLTLKIEDKLAPWNDGTFAMTIRDGRASVVAAPDEPADVAMPVGTLALLYFGALSVPDLVYYDKLSGTPEALDYVGRLFPPCSCYINEWY
jgi:predicted acetyltransferase